MTARFLAAILFQYQQHLAQLHKLLPHTSAMSHLSAALSSTSIPISRAVAHKALQLETEIGTEAHFLSTAPMQQAAMWSLQPRLKFMA